MEQNKIRTYLLYAIGEIILVMIGILLALQVNNWNEERKLGNLETELLSEIRTDLKNDRMTYIESMDRLDTKLQNTAVLKEHMKASRPHHDSLNYYFSAVSLPYGVGVETAGYESLKNAGVLTISSDSLRKTILNYYDFALFVETVTDRYDLGLFFRERIYPEYFQSFSWGGGAVPSDYESLLQTNEFFIALDYVRNDAMFYRGRYEQLLSVATKLLQDVDDELEQR